MRKLYLFIVLAAFSGKQAYSQYTPVQWKKLYDTASTRLIEYSPIYFFGGSTLVKLPNGEALFAADFNGDVGLWRVDANGNLLWRKVFGGSGTEYVNTIRQASDGGFIIAGRTMSNDGLFTGLHGGYDGFVAKTDQNGNLEWVRLIGGSRMDVFTNIEIVSNGYIAVGHTEFVDDPLVDLGIDDVLVTRFSLDGTIIWSKTFSGSNCVRVFTSLVNKNEDIIIGGLSVLSGCNLGNPIRKLLIGLNKDGVKIWQNESITMPASELGSITNLTFNADSSQVYSIVKKGINEQPWLYKFNSLTGVVISAKQLNINISSDFGPTTIRRKSDNNYLVPIASPVYQTNLFQTRHTYLAEIDDTGKVVSLNHFDFNEGVITDLVERSNDLLLFSSQPHPLLPFHVQLAVYNPNPVGEALVIPSGTSPITGGLSTNKATIDPAVQTYNGHPYVQRHYDITPVNNPATATATLTLYFTQQEFDNYNAHGAHGLDLPHNATDNLNKANLRVYQYHGFSTTSQPGSYSGNGVEINPDDAKIVWNATTLQWEVTFDVNGFSGFFIGSAGSSILPVTILSFTGNARDQKALLQWTTTREINVAHFELQRRDHTSDFVSIGKINPAGSSSLEYNYEFTDQLGESPVYHYRLKIVDIDESITYSKIVTIKPGAANTVLSLKPNPAKDFVVVKHPAKNGVTQIRVVDMFGKTLQTVTVTAHSTQTRIVLNGWPKGSYTLVWDRGSEKASQVLIIQ